MIDETLRLSKNFVLKEFLSPDLTVDQHPLYIVERLGRLARELQKVRDALGKPMIISSGYRSKAHNKKVGGASKSMHLQGLAADFDVPGMTADQVRALPIIKNWNGGVELGIDWCHLDLGPKRRFYP